MQVIDKKKTFGPADADITAEQFLTWLLAKVDQSPWRDRVLKAGGILWFIVHTLDSTGYTKVKDKPVTVAADTTIHDLLVDLLQNGGAGFLTYVIEKGQYVTVLPHTYADPPVVYVCPANPKHIVYPETGMFCPVDGTALVEA